MKKCHCGNEIDGRYGYEATENGRIYFCRRCTADRKRAAQANAWQVLRQAFSDNKTDGGSRERAIVNAARIIRAGWVGHTYVMISGGNKLVRFWHRNSSNLPKHA